MSSSEHTDIGPECRAEPVVPLSDEVQGRGADKRRAPGLGDGKLRDIGLSGTGGKDHRAPASRVVPGVDGIPLVGAGSAFREMLKRFQIRPCACIVRIGDLARSACRTVSW